MVGLGALALSIASFALGTYTGHAAGTVELNTWKQNVLSLLHAQSPPLSAQHDSPSLSAQHDSLSPVELTRVDEAQQDRLRRSLVYEGTMKRLTRVLTKARAGTPLRLAVLGGSVSAGAFVDTRWDQYLQTWLQEQYPTANGTGPHELYNGAVGATGSNYFKYCFQNHLVEDPDIVFVELAMNDLSSKEEFDDLKMGEPDGRILSTHVSLTWLTFLQKSQRAWNYSCAVCWA